ncbi:MULTISPECIES: hypothetical protein [unclassified Pseudomonas]|uniref:hypothetical protein n=1 Tax=unclassified Pseudomonas TaxID=196821 RepID=UPI002AC8C01F|nr:MULTISPECIES: hypothetical protein [unclassified Pseudomonas]MEB0039831.1 hypothetical protein [Pseudomonas sp. MH10]MEB0077227.1 hypothetical protein [Pseudomonas sp. MH10out]MEB0091442.1 hypothetical protein [Pseudomonas sp. CCI4.2]MEB0101574.1 hypothetical protein [Pseudomonas sp. CCI3.2]MEB0120684.1 hypothetical protein [Pseudomonas sp. CCI1.2]
MTLEEMNIPTEIKRAAADIIERIEDATGMLDATMAGGVAEGFVLGLDCLKAVSPQHLDELERLFGKATDRKMALLR